MVAIELKMHSTGKHESLAQEVGHVFANPAR